MYRVLLVDDHKLVRYGLVKTVELSRELTVVGEASGGTEALGRLLEQPADLVVTDLDMPGGGLEFVARLHEAHPALRILVLSQHAEQDFALRAFAAGAHGYLTKDADPQTLLAAMLRVASGHRYLTETAQELFLEQLSAPDPSAPPHTYLTSRELEVMRHLARGLRVGEVAEELGISIKTVSTHRARVLEKLGLGSNVAIALYAREHDLL